jgi:trehalose 6-phosphate synthase
MLTDLLPGHTAGSATGGLAWTDDATTVALAATVARARGVWIGRGEDTKPGSMLRRRGLRLAQQDVQDHERHARAAIWPLYHGLGTARFDRDWRTGYRTVNAAFAAAAAEETGPGGTVWVLHHELQLVPGMLRRIRPDLRIGLSLQVPFPAPCVFESMPVHQELLRGLLGADLIGFQTASCADNFLRLIRDVAGRLPRVGVFPVAPDTRAITVLSRRPDVIARARALRRRLGGPRVVILTFDGAGTGADIEQRLTASGVPGGLDDCAVIQVVPGAEGRRPLTARTVAPEQLSPGRRSGPPRLHTFASAPDLPDRVALYLCADVLLATPTAGVSAMPALEFVAAARDDASLVLSEQARTAASLPDAYLVDGDDPESVLSGLAAAIAASTAERSRRIGTMREYVTHHDVYARVRDYLASLRSAPATAPTAASAWPRARRQASGVVTAPVRCPLWRLE